MSIESAKLFIKKVNANGEFASQVLEFESDTGLEEFAMKRGIFSNKSKLEILSLLLGIILMTTSCKSSAGVSSSAKDNTTVNREVVYQISTLNSLMAGNYDGMDTAATLKKNGDFGLGTFDKLDGEMIMIDGKVYQAKDSGAVNEVPDTMKLPFAAVTYFDNDINKELKNINGINTLKTELDKMIKDKAAFYAIRVDGVFSYVKVRSVPKQEKPYPVLSEVTKNQPTFEYRNMKGSLVGFWCPDYVGAVNVPGYHLHFISTDRTKGGHLIEVNMENGTADLDVTKQFNMKLSDVNSNTAETQKNEDIKKVEQ